MTTPETTAQNSYDAILAAAEDVVRETGAIHLTLDAVCAKAGVSKGGLLYHFHTKEALIRAMLTRMPQIVLERSTQIASTLPAGPVRELKAVILAARDVLASGKFQGLSSSLLAAAYDPALFAPVREHRAKTINEMHAATGLSKSFISTIFLALEGLWFFESLNITQNPQERQDVTAQLLRFVDAEERRLSSNTKENAEDHA